MLFASLRLKQFAAIILLTTAHVASAATPLSHLSLERWGLAPESTSYKTHLDSYELDQRVRGGVATEIFLMCTSFRDLGSDSARSIQVIRTNDQSYFLVIPFDLGITKRTMWLLANEMKREKNHDVAEIKVNWNAWKAAPQAQARAQQFAEQFVKELNLNGFKTRLELVTDDLETPTGTILAEVRLPPLATVFKDALLSSNNLNLANEQTLRLSLKRKSTDAKLDPTYRDLVACFSQLISNFETAPEFLTLFKASRSGLTKSRRILSVDDESGYLFVAVDRPAKDLEVNLIGSRQIPKNRPDLESQFPDIKSDSIKSDSIKSDSKKSDSKKSKEE